MSLPEGWVQAPLLDVARLHDGKRIPLNAAERAAMPGAYPYFGANGQVGSVGQYLFDGDYILLAEDGGYFDDPTRGVAYEASGRFWVNNHAHILSTEDGIPRRYLCRLLNTIDWMRFVSGTTRLKLTQGGMQRIALPIPPLAEQLRIVTKLDVLLASLFRARAEFEQAIKLASNLRASILRSCFSRGAAQTWPRVAIETILTEGLIGLVRSKEEQQSTGTLYVRMNHYNLEGRWNKDKLTHVTCTQEEIQRFALRRGDVLFNTRNSVELVGKVAIWPGSKENFVYNNNLLRMRFRESVFAEFVGRYMMSPPFQEALAQHKSATTSVAAIYQRSLYKLPVPLPPLDEQREVAARIDTAFAHADHLQAEAARGRELVDRLEAAILAKAFKGELVPQDSNDEPASVLLDRIRAQRAAAPKTKRGR